MKFSTIFAAFSAIAVAAAADSNEYVPLTDLEISITEEAPSCAIKASAGDVISVHYTGSLRKDGKEFDSSLTRGRPFSFTLGNGQVIQGWDQGLIGACIGEKRVLEIPSEMGYGQYGAGSVIPPNADLVFDVQVMNIIAHDEL